MMEAKKMTQLPDNKGLWRHGGIFAENYMHTHVCAYVTSEKCLHASTTGGIHA